MKTLIIAIMLAILTFGIAGCSNISKADVGTAGGAVLGGVAGHALGGNTASTIGGAVVGGFIGNRVGQSMDNN